MNEKQKIDTLYKPEVFQGAKLHIHIQLQAFYRASTED